MRRSDTGSATVFAMVCFVLAAVFSAAGMLDLANTAAALARVNAAADAAALAGAAAYGRGEDIAAAATVTAAENGARLVGSPELATADATVTVEAAADVRLHTLGTVTVRARAAAQSVLPDISDVFAEVEAQ